MIGWLSPSMDVLPPASIFMFDREYQVPLPEVVGNALAAEIKSSKNGFAKSAAFSSASAIARIREKPRRLYFEAGQDMAYAEIWMQDVRFGSGTGPSQGFFSQFLFVTQELADHLLDEATNKKRFSSDVSRFLRDADVFIRTGCGFELLRTWYGLDRNDLASFSLGESKNAPSTARIRARLTFKSFASRP